MVETISMFKIKYCVEVPDDVEEGAYPTSPINYAMDTVVCNEAKEFTQKYLEEVISDANEVTLEEAIAQYRKDEPTLGEAWDDETIIKNHITPVGKNEND